MKQKIAVPVVDGYLSNHFGHCQHFFIAEVDNGAIQQISEEEPPPHAPGVIPRWLNERGVDVVLVGGIGQKALTLFQNYNIRPIIGVASAPPQELVANFLENELTEGVNQCNH
mgnify:CR=1 FL=1